MYVCVCVVFRGLHRTEGLRKQMHMRIVHVHFVCFSVQILKRIFFHVTTGDTILRQRRKETKRIIQAVAEVSAYILSMECSYNWTLIKHIFKTCVCGHDSSSIYSVRKPKQISIVNIYIYNVYLRLSRCTEWARNGPLQHYWSQDRTVIMEMLRKNFSSCGIVIHLPITKASLLIFPVLLFFFCETNEKSTRRISKCPNAWLNIRLILHFNSNSD